MPDAFGSVAALLAQAVSSRATPGAALEAGTEQGPIWRHTAGRLTYEDDAPEVRADTVYDLASLTKVIATTTLAMRLVEDGRLGLHDPVGRHVGAWRGRDRRHATVRDLLEHSAGLVAWAPLYRECTTHEEFVAAISGAPLEYLPWTRAVYSDLGFILLGAILAGAGEQPLERQFAAFALEVRLEDLDYRPPAAWRPRTAPTEVDSWRGRLLAAEVHDENAAALGGVAGHAGLFGTLAAVGGFARLVLATRTRETALGRPAALTRFVTRSTVPGSSRALGWDTMLPSSSCGGRFSAGSIGHTGFTGTSLWIDLARGIYVVLLANRVHPSRSNESWRAYRPRIHDAVIDAISTRSLQADGSYGS